MTNLDWIRSLPAEDLAELLVSENHVTSYICDDCDNDEYLSPDGTGFYFREDAVEYIKGWLGEEKY